MRVFIVIGIVGLVIVALGLLLRKVPRGSKELESHVDQLSGQNRAVAKAFLRRESLSLTVALVAGLGVAIGVWVLGGMLTNLYGLPYALAGVAGSLAGLLIINLWPRFRWPSDDLLPRVAGLVPRSALSFGRQWTFILPLATAVILVLALVLAGSYSGTDEKGLHRVYAYRSLSGWGVENGQVVDVQYNMGSTGPFPGWYYGLPLIACTVLFIAAVYWTLRRTALAARPTVPELFEVDTAVRSLRTRFVMAVSSAVLGFQIAGVGAITGVALRNANVESVPTADLYLTPNTIEVEPGYTLAIVLIFVSLAIAVATVVLLVRAVAIVLKVVDATRSSDKPQSLQATP